MDLQLGYNLVIYPLTTSTTKEDFNPGKLGGLLNFEANAQLEGCAPLKGHLDIAAFNRIYRWF